MLTMGTPNTVALPQPNVAFRCFNAWGSEVNAAEHPEFAEYLAEPEELHADLNRVVGEIGVPKPKWAVTAEIIARKFLRRAAGITSSAPIFHLDEDPMLDTIGMREPVSTVAMVVPLVDGIMVRHQLLKEIYREAGLYGAAGVLVHEGFHAGARLGAVALQIHTEGDVILRGRCGLVTVGTKGLRGAFFEEGTAVMVQAKCMTKKKVIAPGLAQSEMPSKQLLPVYAAIQNLGSIDRTAGPDGYSMDLLAWGAERRGIMPATDFLNTLVATRGTAPPLQSLRTIPRVINAIQPGLYDQLQALEYGTDAWQQGLAMVYTAVTE